MPDVTAIGVAADYEKLKARGGTSFIVLPSAEAAATWRSTMRRLARADRLRIRTAGHLATTGKAVVCAWQVGADRSDWKDA